MHNMFRKVTLLEILGSPLFIGVAGIVARVAVMYTYLFDRKQRTKIGIFYSSWQDILSGIPQGSILEPLLFNVFLCDLFLIIDNIDFASYADDNTPYTTDGSAKESYR